MPGQPGRQRGGGVMAVSDPDRFRAVLAGLVYPARTWQLCAQADAYGADSQTREALNRLPAVTHASLDADLTELHVARTDL